MNQPPAKRRQRMSLTPQEFHIHINPQLASSKATSLLAKASELSIQEVKQAMQKGAVWLESSQGIRRIRRADSKVSTGDSLHFYYSPKILATEPLTPSLMSDEEHYSIWYKPSGMLCQGSKWSDHCTITRWIEINKPFTKKPDRNCFIVHRLDKATSGLIIIGHSKKTTQALSSIFQARQIQKRYHAVVEGQFPNKKPSQNEITLDAPVDNKAALSIAKLIKYDPTKNQSLVDVEIKTGRKHQIRLHLSQAGYPIVGDRLYGNADHNTVDLQLCAYHLSFTCPLTQQEQLYKLPKAFDLAF